ncbi:MAG TPA: type II toxin-antitoxin system PemK/MazF family toxin [Rhizomicrobium sp.]|jgi:mRNA interferase MazF
MRRGDIVTVAMPGVYGKPRPAVVIQSDNLGETDSVLVCLVTSTIRDASLYRLDLPADQKTGLRAPSQIMVDKIMAVRRAKCSAPIGKIEPASNQMLNGFLAVVLGIAD